MTNRGAQIAVSKISKFPISKSLRGRPKKLPRALRKHLKTAWDEVFFLNHYAEVFRQLTEIIERSTVRNEKSHLWDFLHWATVSELVHRLDRICEPQWKSKKKRVLSLGAFLEDLEPYAHLVTREHFVGVRPNTVRSARRKKSGKPGDLYLWSFMNEQFDKLVGKTKSSLTSADIKRDLRKIKTASKKITLYRNKHLAHVAFDRHKYKGPSVEEILQTISVITSIKNKYALLIFNWSSPDLPYIDITRIFTKAWILDNNVRNELIDLQRSRRPGTAKIRVTPIPQR